MLLLSPTALVDEIYIPSRLGSLQIEILASTRRHGRIPYRIEPNMKSLFSEIAAGNPRFSITKPWAFLDTTMALRRSYWF